MKKGPDTGAVLSRVLSVEGAKAAAQRLHSTTMRARIDELRARRAPGAERDLMSWQGLVDAKPEGGGAGVPNEAAVLENDLADNPFRQVPREELLVVERVTREALSRLPPGGEAALQAIAEAVERGVPLQAFEAEMRRIDEAAGSLPDEEGVPAREENASRFARWIPLLLLGIGVAAGATWCLSTRPPTLSSRAEGDARAKSQPISQEVTPEPTLTGTPANESAFPTLTATPKASAVPTPIVAPTLSATSLPAPSHSTTIPPTKSSAPQPTSTSKIPWYE